MDFEKLQIKEHVRIIYKHRKTLLVCVASLVLPLGILLMLAKPQYRSSVALEISDSAVTRLLTSDIDVSPDLTVGNHMDIMTSQTFASRVVQAVANRHPEILPGVAQEKDQGSGLTRFFKGLAGSNSAPLAAHDQAVIDLLDRMQTDHRGGNMIKVSVDFGDPDKAYLYAQTIGEEFTQFNLETIQQRIDLLNNFYHAQLERAFERLKQAEERLAGFQRQFGVTSADRESARLMDRIENLENQILEITSQKKLAESRIATLDKQLTQMQQKTPTLASMELQLPRIEELKHRLLTLENQIISQQALYTEKHPKVQGLRRDIDATKHELRSLAGRATEADTNRNSDPAVLWHDLYIERLLAEVEAANLNTRMEGLQSLSDDYRSRLLSENPEQTQELVKIGREVEVAQDAYQAMLRTNERIQGLEAEKAMNVNLIEPAQRPLQPLPRSRKFKMITGIFVGLILGIGLAYLREALDRSIKTTEEIERKLGLPVLGVVVDFNHQSHGHKPASSSGTKHKTASVDDLILLEDPSSEAAENFRSLRANTDLTLQDFENHQIIMVTSPGSGEGKTTIALNLAASFTLYGKKTLLLDTDFYHPTMHLALGASDETGLTNWLAEEIRPETMRSSVSLNGSALDFIPTGTGKVTFQKLAINSKMKTLLSALREQYELIVIDAPPVIQVSDPLLIAPYVDLVLMVIESGRTQLDAACYALKILKKAKSPGLGAILNRLRPEEQYGPSNYFKSYRSERPSNALVLRSARR